jgi:DNA-binding CsgD family transcriptional regulator
MDKIAQAIAQPYDYDEAAYKAAAVALYKTNPRKALKLFPKFKSYLTGIHPLPEKRQRRPKRIKTNYKVSQQLINQSIVQLHEDGMNDAQIAAELCITQARVYNYLYKSGLLTKRKKSNLDDQLIIKLFKEGKSAGEIAGEFFIHVTLISDILRKNNLLNVKKYKYGNKTLHGLKAYTSYVIKVKQEAIKMYNEGKAKEQIGKYFGLSTTSIVRLLRK